MVSYRTAATAIAVALGLAAGSSLLGPTQVMAQDIGEEEELLVPSQEPEDDDLDDQGQHVQQPMALEVPPGMPESVLPPEVAGGCPAVTRTGPDTALIGQIAIWDQNGDGRISIGEQLRCLEQVAQTPVIVPAMPPG